LTEHMEGITSFREAHPDQDGRFIDIKYHELVSDQMTVLRQIYQRLDMPLTEMAAEKMQSLASRRSRYKGRRGDRKPADFEVDETLDWHRLETYCFRFGIPCPHSELSRPYRASELTEKRLPYSAALPQTLSRRGEGGRRS
jgi:hypothetical protein